MSINIDGIADHKNAFHLTDHAGKANNLHKYREENL